MMLPSRIFVQGQGPPLGIAHAYGNRRDLLNAALQAGVDMVECDVWFQGGRFWARHERRLGFLPLLVDWRRHACHGMGGLSLPLGPFYIRWDISPLPLDEVIFALSGRALLLWDAKGEYSPSEAKDYVRSLRLLLSRLHAEERVVVCGQNWDLLWAIRDESPSPLVFLTVHTLKDWERLVALPSPPAGVCLHRSLTGDAQVAYLRQENVPFLCWTVDEEDEALRLVSLGAKGIISNRLDLLLGLRQANAGEGSDVGLG